MFQATVRARTDNLGGLFGAAPLASDAASRQALEELHTRRAVGDLPAGQEEGNRTAEFVGERVDLGRAPAARAGPRAGPIALVLCPLCRRTHSGEAS